MTDDGEDELVELRREVASLREDLAQERARVRDLEAEVTLFRRGLDALTDSVNIRDAGYRNIYANPVALRWMNVSTIDEVDTAARRWRYLHEDGREFTREEVPTWRALHGDDPSPQGTIALHVDDGKGTQRWLQGFATALRDDSGALLGVINIVHDITQERADQRALAARTASLRERDAEKQALIARLEEMVLELSAPALEVWERILVVPVVGSLSERRGRELLESTLRAVQRRGARLVIVDLTGARVDSAISAEQLARLVRALELLGARSALAGVKPALASFLVEHELAPRSVVTHRSLRYALRAAIEG